MGIPAFPEKKSKLVKRLLQMFTKIRFRFKSKGSNLYWRNNAQSIELCSFPSPGTTKSPGSTDPCQVHWTSQSASDPVDDAGIRQHIVSGTPVISLNKHAGGLG